MTQRAEDKPLILTGDFNANKDSFAYQLLTKDGLFDVYRSANARDFAAGTFHGYGQVTEPIDWVLASGHFEVTSAHVDDHHEGNLYPSDHYPITATLQWKGTEHAQ